MPKEFIIVVSTHRKLGELFIPYIIERNQGQPFFQLFDLATTGNIKKNINEISEPCLEIIKLTSDYSENNIWKIFSKKKNLKEFFDTLEQNLVISQIRPFIEKRIDKILSIISESKIPVFKKDKNYQLIYDTENINVLTKPVFPVFNFIKTETDFKYFLTLRNENKDVKLFKLNYKILSNKPCIILVENNLYRVEDIDSKKLLPFFSKEKINIPKNREKEYMESFVKNAILNYPINSSGFDIIEKNENGKAIINVEENLKGEPIILLGFQYDRAFFPYGTKQETFVFLEENDNLYKYIKYRRNSSWEKEMAIKLISLGFEYYENSTFQLKGVENKPISRFYELISWLNSNSESINENSFSLKIIKTDRNFYTGSIKLELKVEDAKDWFDVHAVVKLKDFEFPFIRFRKHIIMGTREFTLPDNQVVILPEEWFSRYRDIFVFGIENEENVKLNKYHFRIIQEAMTAETGNELLKLYDRLNGSKDENFISPGSLNATLREYQKVGIQWMYDLHRFNMGGCLADDMGLGKTIQAITLLLKVNENTDNTALIHDTSRSTTQLSLFDIPAFTGIKTVNSSLIIVPVSLIHNWENEISRFAQSLKIHKFFGTQRTRNFDDLLNVDIVITSYGVVRNDIENLSRLKFKYIILDESQIIKNPDSKIYKAVVQLQSEYKLVLTGTPIENSLIDLWAQLNFLNRDLLKSLHYFREEFVIPIEKHNDFQKQKKLQTIISPFILRRRKEEVLKELPSLTEQVILCEMTDDQQKIYETEKSSIRNLIYDNIEKRGFEKSSILILKALNKLRLMANHPVLCEPGYESDSGKFDEIARSIESLIEEKHKVLIFSSYVKHLDLVAKYLRSRSWPFAMLTGMTRDRQNIIETFQQDNEIRVFLISLKAGGIGLNLTAADYVFILDPWWNPAAENQALSRAHRIGQDKKVFVYRFISRNSIEEKIQVLQQKKSALADLFINNNNPFRNFKREEIEELFN